MKTITILLLILFTIKIQAQFKDSKEKTVFSIDAYDVNRVKLTGSEASLELNIYTWKDKWFSTQDLNKITTLKYNSIFIKGGLTNVKKFVDVDAFTMSDQGYTLGISFLHSGTEIISTEFGLTTARFSIDYRRENVRNYDPFVEKDVESKRRHPESLISTFSLSHYYTMEKYVLAIAVNAQGGVTNNLKNLDDYKKVNDKMVDGSYVHFKEFDGKYGTIQTGLVTTSMAISVPIIRNKKYNLPENWFWGLPLTGLIPYASYQTLTHFKPSYNVGANIGLFSSSIFKDEAGLVDVKRSKNDISHSVPYKKKFNAASSLSIGCDYIFSSGAKPSKPNWFLSGTITFK